MSQEQAAELKELASEIFVGFTERVGLKHWDWNPLADAAIEAAESFTKVFESRYNPQSATPQPPEEIAASDPAVSAAVSSQAAVEQPAPTP